MTVPGRALGASVIPALEAKEEVLLQVPSAIVPETANFLFNPMHTGAAEFRITDEFAYSFDIRLKT